MQFTAKMGLLLMPTNSKLSSVKMSTSHYASRPPQNDVGADTIRIPLDGVPKNVRRTNAQFLFCIGILLLMADGLAMKYFAENLWEALIIAVLTVPLALLVIFCALEARK